MTQHPSPAALKKCPGERVLKKSLDFHYINIGEAGENRRQEIIEQITSGIFLTPTFRFTHTHKKMKLGRSNSPYNTPMYGAACGPVKGQQLGDRGEGGGGCLTQGPGSEYFCRQVGSSSNESWPSVYVACKLAKRVLYFIMMLTTASFTYRALPFSLSKSMSPHTATVGNGVYWI